MSHGDEQNVKPFYEHVFLHQFIYSRASLVPFVFSFDTAYTGDPEEPAEETAEAAATFVVH